MQVVQYNEWRQLLVTSEKVPILFTKHIHLSAKIKLGFILHVCSQVANVIASVSWVHELKASEKHRNSFN